MKSILSVIVVLLCCSAIANGAYVIQVSNFPTITAGVVSLPIFVSTPIPPTGAFTVDLSTTSGSTTIQPASLSFDTNTDAASFTITSTDTTVVTISFTLNGNSDPFTAPLAVNFLPALRTVNIDNIYSLPVDSPSDPLQIAITVPSGSPLVFSPTADNANVIFNPNPVTIQPNTLSASFTVYYNAVFYSSSISVTWAVSGSDNAYYQTITTTKYNVASSNRGVQVSTFPSNVLLAGNSTVLYAYTTDTVNSTLTVVPQAADTVFNPPSFVFSPGVQLVPFTFNTTTTSPSKNFYFTIQETDQIDYVAPPTTAVNVPLKTVTLVYPTEYYQNKPTQISVRISAPVVSDLTVALFAANVVFNETSVTFTGTTTAILVDVYPIAAGDDTISALLSGTDAIYYKNPGTKVITVSQGQFLGLSNWYIPSLWLGVQSDSIPVRVNVAPTSTVTVTFVAPDLVFNPPSLTFTPSVLQQTFTITPTFTSTDASNSAVSGSNIKVLVSGDDWSLYSAPTDIFVTVLRRQIQIVWTPYLTGSTLYLSSRYNVWATANYVDSPITVTPVNPYMTFDPPVLQFTSSQLQVRFVVTVNAVAASTTITYLIGGVNGGLYANVNSTAFTTALRTFSFATAVIAPDSRVASSNAVLVASPSVDDLSNNHIYSFALSSLQVPTGSLTITPTSLHVTFSPPSLTFGTGGLTTVYNSKRISHGEQRDVSSSIILANFNVTAKSAGKHEVWFVLSGSDALSYQAPPHTFFSFWMDTVPKESATSRVMASISVLLIVILAVIV